MDALDPPSRRSHVALGGAVGALTRTAVVLAAASGALGTEVVALVAANLLGGAALGWLVARADADARWRRLLPLVGTGFLGALTTFSTLAEQLASRVTDGEVAAAAVLGVVSLAGGWVAAALGLRLGSRGRRAGEQVAV